MNKRNVLFITYDGLTDPLGQSQILPYMSGLSELGHKITILSCEKADRFTQFSETITSITKKSNMNWDFISFTTKPPILAKIYDFWRLLAKARKMVKAFSVDTIHCRSYIAADIGLRLKNEFGCKVVFDMRGFWADERKDSGAWNQDNFLFKRLYQNYKNKERNFILNSNYIITLTNAAKNEIMSWDYARNKKLSIATIPCCADLNHFSLTSLEQKQIARNRLDIDNDKFVVSYLGSIGAWYMLNEMLQFFKILTTKYTNSIFLFITHSNPQLILAGLTDYKINPKSVKVVSASRDDVSLYIKASDVNISFIKPVYSKIASSPTKNAEVLATGIPIILNAGIGDVDELTSSGASYAINEFSDDEYIKAVDKIDDLLELTPEYIRQSIATNYDLSYAIATYDYVYQQL